MANIKATQTSNSDEWATPQWLWDALNREFHFTLDAAATPENAKTAKFFAEEDDGLAQSWAGHTTWLNPPYSQIARWIAKAYEEAVAGRATTVCLVPARTDTRYWWDYIRHGEVRFLKGRVKFVGGSSSAPFPSAVVVFRKGMLERAGQATTVYWGIRERDGRDSN